MMQSIRDLEFRWFIILMGMIAILSGMAMTNGDTIERTLLCFDKGSIYVQGVTCIVFGILFIGLGIYVILKKNITTFYSKKKAA